MLRLCSPARFRAARIKKLVDPLELFGQLRVGAVPPLQISRAFIQTHFQREIFEKRITEARILSLDARSTASLLKDLLMEKYLAVPYRVFAFDLEFTGLPRFHSDGPSEEIVELAIYCPQRKQSFSTLVKTVNCSMSDEARVLTGITQQMIDESGVPFADAWKDAMAFMTGAIGNIDDSSAAVASTDNLLLLSHGGKLADVSMIEWSIKKNGMLLSPSIKFGDTFQLIRELHRKRPVTPDKYPPSWNLQDMASWLKLNDPPQSHRAAADAQLTWDVVYHMLDRYGDHSIAPEQQLVGRFFEKAATNRVAAITSSTGGAVSPAVLGEDATAAMDGLDDIF